MHRDVHQATCITASLGLHPATAQQDDYIARLGSDVNVQPQAESSSSACYTRCDLALNEDPFSR